MSNFSFVNSLAGESGHICRCQCCSGDHCNDLSYLVLARQIKYNKVILGKFEFKLLICNHHSFIPSLIN